MVEEKIFDLDQFIVKKITKSIIKTVLGSVNNKKELDKQIE